MLKVLVDDLNKLKEFALRLSQNDLIALDCETEGLFPPDDDIVGFSIAFSEEEGYYFPLKHADSKNLPKEIATKIFSIIKFKKIIFHNAEFDLHMIWQHFNIKLPLYGDTMLMANCLGYERLALKYLINKIYSIDTLEFDTLLEEKFGKSWKKHNCSELKSEEVSDYAINDVLYTFKLYNFFKDAVAEQYASIYKIELNLIPVVVTLNANGVKIDRKILEEQLSIAESQVNVLLDEIKQYTKPTFQPNSTRDVREAMLEMNLKSPKRSKKTGDLSYDAEVLKDLGEVHPFPKALLEYRSQNKFISGYLKKIPTLLDENSLMYKSYRSIDAAESGRFTCPGSTNHFGEDKTINNQNIPKEGKMDYDVRSAFIAPDGYTWVKSDFSQVESRVAASLSGDRNMINAFKSGIDLHSYTARYMMGIPDDQEVTKEQRAIGKVLNLGTMYGLSEYSVAKKTGHTEDEAAELLQRYFSTYPRLKAYIDYCTNFVRKNKFVKTFFGRKRALDYEFTNVKRIQDDFLKKGFNTVIQGTAADLLKIAMLRCKTYVLDRYPDVKMMEVVHDEIDFIVPNDIVEEVCYAIKYAMEIPLPSEEGKDWAPLIADVSYGNSWSEKTHTSFEPEDYPKQQFTSWKEILPAEFGSPLEDENYVVNW